MANMKSAAELDATIRTLQPEDFDAVVELDAVLTGSEKAAYWTEVFVRFLRDERCIGLAAHDGTALEGYLFGELRAFEFGSEPCGWVVAVGVKPDTTRRGVASALLTEVCRRFGALGASAVRTMVRRNDVPFLSLFRAQGFVGGPFVQLERPLVSEQESENES